MGLKSKLFTAAKPAWFLVVAGATITVYSGQAEPYVSPAQLPQGPEYMFGGAAGVLVIGIVFILALESRLESGSWEAAGRRAGLTPEGQGKLVGRSDLSGIIEGRTVRARTVTRTQKGSDGSTRRRFTIVEADLNNSAETGALVAPGGRGILSTGSAKLEIGPDTVVEDDQLAVIEGDQLTVIGHDEAAVQAISSGQSGDALRAMDGVNLVFVGNTSEVVTSLVSDPDAVDSGLGSLVQEKMMDRAEGALTERVPGDSATVSAETVGLVVDGDQLKQRAEAVAAVADAFEETTSDP